MKLLCFILLNLTLAILGVAFEPLCVSSLAKGHVTTETVVHRAASLLRDRWRPGSDIRPLLKEKLGKNEILEAFLKDPDLVRKLEALLSRQHSDERVDSKVEPPSKRTARAPTPLFRYAKVKGIMGAGAGVWSETLQGFLFSGRLKTQLKNTKRLYLQRVDSSPKRSEKPIPIDLAYPAHEVRTIEISPNARHVAYLVLDPKGSEEFPRFVIEDLLHHQVLYEDTSIALGLESFRFSKDGQYLFLNGTPVAELKDPKYSNVFKTDMNGSTYREELPHAVQKLLKIRENRVSDIFQDNETERKKRSRFRNLFSRRVYNECFLSSESPEASLMVDNDSTYSLVSFGPLGQREIPLDPKFNPTGPKPTKNWFNHLISRNSKGDFIGTFSNDNTSNHFALFYESDGQIKLRYRSQTPLSPNEFSHLPERHLLIGFHTRRNSEMTSEPQTLYFLDDRTLEVTGQFDLPQDLPDVDSLQVSQDGDTLVLGHWDVNALSNKVYSVLDIKALAQQGLISLPKSDRQNAEAQQQRGPSSTTLAPSAERNPFRHWVSMKRLEAPEAARTVFRDLLRRIKDPQMLSTENARGIARDLGLKDLVGFEERLQASTETRRLIQEALEEAMLELPETRDRADVPLVPAPAPHKLPPVLRLIPEAGRDEWWSKSTWDPYDQIYLSVDSHSSEVTTFNPETNKLGKNPAFFRLLPPGHRLSKIEVDPSTGEFLIFHKDDFPQDERVSTFYSSWADRSLRHLKNTQRLGTETPKILRRPDPSGRIAIQPILGDQLDLIPHSILKGAPSSRGSWTLELRHLDFPYELSTAGLERNFSFFGDLAVGPWCKQGRKPEVSELHLFELNSLRVTPFKLSAPLLRGRGTLLKNGYYLGVAAGNKGEPHFATFDLNDLTNRTHLSPSYQSPPFDPNHFVVDHKRNLLITLDLKQSIAGRSKTRVTFLELPSLKIVAEVEVPNFDADGIHLNEDRDSVFVWARKRGGAEISFEALAHQGLIK